MYEQQRIANRDQERLVIDLEDIKAVSCLRLPFLAIAHIAVQYQDTATDLVANIKNNAKRYVDLFSSVIDTKMPAPTKDLTSKDDVLDVIMHQRKEKNAQNEEEGLVTFPPNLTRR